MVSLPVAREYGHLGMARIRVVKVLKCSVEFGRPLRSKKGKDGTEYVIGVLPLGGYVKILDERECDVRPDELNQIFNRQLLCFSCSYSVCRPSCQFCPRSSSLGLFSLLAFLKYVLLLMKLLLIQLLSRLNTDFRR